MKFGKTWHEYYAEQHKLKLEKFKQLRKGVRKYAWLPVLTESGVAVWLEHYIQYWSDDFVQNFPQYSFYLKNYTEEDFKKLKDK